MAVPRLRRPAALIACTATVLAVVGTALPATAADLPTLVINEVESDGGTPGDWVELMNTGTAAVDASGMVVKDNDDTHSFTIPAGTTIEPGASWVADVDPSFGLGKADTARLLTADGSLVDTYTWAAHAATSYGRCPDGSGAFRVTTSVTRGAANDCSSPVRLSEIESSGGTPGDWVELVNPSTGAVDLSGYVVKDSDDTHTFTVPAGTTIEAGGYWVAEVDASFGLGGADSARLFDATGTLVDAYSWTAHAGTTYGRCPTPSGDFTTTAAATKGSANDCGITVPAGLVINEVESSGGTPGDWVELKNTGSTDVDASGLLVKDGDDTHAFSVIPAGTTIAAGGYYVVEETALGFGLGSADSARLFASDGVTVIDSSTWAAHATTTYGRCPDGTGTFGTTTSSTKGAANDCSSPIRINEVESSGGTPGDWVELKNNGLTSVDLSGWTVKDNDDTHAFTLPAGTTIAAGGYVVADVDASFGLGGADSARLFDATGTLVDTYTWAAHASTTYGRCPDGTGEFTTTTASTRAAVNACPGDLVTSIWPGAATVTTVDVSGFLGGNMSGLAYEPSGTSAKGTLWAVKNGPGTLYQLTWDGSAWVAADDADWAAGKALHFPDGTGNPDTEGVTLAPDGSVYASIERDNDASGTSRLGVLRFDPSTAGTSLSATTEWNLVADLPAVAANSGLEAITWVPDSYLTANGFVDQLTGAAYDPAAYPGHGSGLYLVGLEANGHVYAYALNADGTYARLADVATGFTGVMDLQFDAERQQVWAVCDDTCDGRSAVLSVASEGAASGQLVVDTYFERPASSPNINNEGFAVAPQAECVDGTKPVYWSDDSATDGYALRMGSVECTVPVVAPEITAQVVGTANASGWYRNATVRFTCTEHSAPLTEPCPADVVLTDGADQDVTATVTATDGGTATATLTGLDVDGAAPTVTLGGVASGSVYFGRAPAATCTGADALSGLATCALSMATASGRTTVTATATDTAGNTATATATYQVLTTYVRGATYRNGVFEVKAGQRYTIVTVSSTPALLLGPIGLPTSGGWLQVMRVQTLDGLKVAAAPVTVARAARPGSTGIAWVTTGRSTSSVVLRTVR
ncbi:MAG: lamin tail domain-containing protein [Cellulomonas sp.]|nr:lamin tail domain-containing protein [Cellulomonas sp.]